jgi:hypothetical protein
MGELGYMVAERARITFGDEVVQVGGATPEAVAAARTAHVGEGVGELAAAEFARLSRGDVQVTPAMAEAPVSHAA